MEIFGIGLPEVLVIAIVALIVLGPERLPEAARTLGKAVADFRRAIEPARSAWNDVTRELTSAVQIEEPRIPGPDQPGGNPWVVHPLAEGLSDEERARFFATGEIPAWKRLELDMREDPTRLPMNGAGKPGGEELDYPAPHEPKHSAQENPEETTLEELDYPAPNPAPGDSGPGA